MTYQILRVLPGDEWAVPRLQDIGRRTFAHTFEQDNDPQELARYLEETFNAEQVRRELSNPQSLFYLLTDEQGRDAGYLKLNFAPAFSDEVDLPDALELQRIYLLPSEQGRGGGRLLLNEALAVAREHGLRHIWLGVWEHNEPALAFYRRLGFQQFGQHTFMFGAEAQTDLLMSLTLPEESGQAAMAD